MTEVRVSIEDELLSAIDAEAARRSLSREVFLVEAARRALSEAATGAPVGTRVNEGDPLIW